jgi:hypothetical protein
MANEHIETLKLARERLVVDRRACAEILAAPFRRPDSIDARAAFNSLQATIDAIDEAIEDEGEIDLERRQAEAVRASRQSGPENAYGSDDDA